MKQINITKDDKHVRLYVEDDNGHHASIVMSKEEIKRFKKQFVDFIFSDSIALNFFKEWRNENA